MTGVNEQDVRALTYLAARIRSETHGAGRWDEAGIAAKISELKGQGLAQVVERVARHASDRDAKTPGAILRPFLPDAPVSSSRVPFDPALFCDICFKREDRHTDHDGHDFISALDAKRRRPQVDAAARVQDIKQHIACEEPQ
jgi:hypothetical protein